MKKIASLLIMSILTGGILPSLAFSADRRDEGPPFPTERQQSRHDSRHDDNPRSSGHRMYERAHFMWNGHNFRKGKVVPRGFQADRYRVKDWRARGLYAPPHGQRWSYINGNYVLIAAATGVITAILIDRVGG